MQQKRYSMHHFAYYVHLFTCKMNAVKSLLHLELLKPSMLMIWVNCPCMFECICEWKWERKKQAGLTFTSILVMNFQIWNALVTMVTKHDSASCNPNFFHLSAHTLCFFPICLLMSFKHTTQKIYKRAFFPNIWSNDQLK